MLKYEIIPKEDTVLVTVTDANVADHLDMSQEPPIGCMLVQQSKTDVLGQINLEKMLSNLNNCVDLLQITFNAVDSFHLQSRVQELSYQFNEAMNSSNAAALDFQLSAGEALEICIYAYASLMEGDVQAALNLLTGTKDTAAQMAADVRELDSEYQELREREIREEKRAYGMELASLIIGSLGSIVGTFSQNTQSSRSDRDDVERETHKTVSAEDQAKRDYSKNISRQTAIASELEKIDARIQRIDEVLDGELYLGGANNAKADSADPDAKETDEALRQEKQSKVDEKAALNQELNGLKGEESAIQDTLTGLGVAIDDISEKTRSAAQDIQNRADSLAARRKELSKKRDELKAMERKNLMDLARDTAKMKNMVMSANSLESAVQCMVIAIGCLRKVLAYLQDIKLFWINVEVFCSSLAGNSNLAKLISVKQNHPAEECTVFFTSKIFVSSYLGLMAKWQALCVIFGEYHAALMEISARMSKAMQQSLSTDRTEKSGKEC